MITPSSQAFIRFAGLVLAGVLTSCVTADRRVPMAAPAAGVDNFQFGRTVYMTDCTKCHAAEPIREYSLEEWNQILPEMAAEANLSGRELHALENYVYHIIAAR